MSNTKKLMQNNEKVVCISFFVDKSLKICYNNNIKVA